MPNPFSSQLNSATLPFFNMRLPTETFLLRKPATTFFHLSKPTMSSPCSTIVPNQKKEKKEEKEKKKVIVISGPTCAGKSRLALDLAKRLHGEIISADSVQIYRGLDIGSAKPSLADQREVPHHLLDILHPSEDYSAGQFFHDARNAADEILTNGKTPLVVGGTGLYLRWFIYGKPEVPKSPPEITSQVFSDLMPFQEKGKWNEAVDLVVNAGDPSARHFPLNNWYRLRRSLTIIRSSGSPPSSFTIPYDSFKNQKTPKEKIPKDLDYDFLCFFLTCPRVDLYRAIDLRCEEMLAETDGLLSEASWLLDIGLLPNTNSATRAIGYRHAIEYLLKCRNNGGSTTSEELHGFLSEFQKSSRNFAKRQWTWFRNESLYHWIDASTPLETVVSFVCNAYNEGREKVMVPENLRMKKDVDDLQENRVLKSYRSQNQIFRNESDCRHVLDWVGRTQRRLEA